MNTEKVLFISGAVGLGHVGRDLEIAKALRKEHPEIDISWLADHPATMVLKDAGEKLLDEANLLTHGTTRIENSAEEYTVNGIKWMMDMRKEWSENAKIFAKITGRENFDIVIGDEAFDICIGLYKNPSLKKFPFVIIYDFIGLDAVTYSPINRIATYSTNRLWVRFLTAKPPLADRQIFIGEIEDVPDRKFGFMLPNRRELTKKYVNFVGYVLRFNPEAYRDKKRVRKKLGYEEEPIVVCSIGGTTTGTPLLNLCVKTYPIIKKEIPDLKMILVCGPRLPTNSLQTTEGIEVRGYVPELYEHFAAADLCIVTGGGTITLELTALQQPFLYFPLEQHFEQEIDVATRCERHHAGIKMKYSRTTPESLAKAVISNIGRKVEYAEIPTDGAQKAAKLVSELF